MSSIDPFGPISEQQTTYGQRKRQPPPRPPPPKTAQQTNSGKNITNISIFGRRKTQKPPATAIVRPLPPSLNVPTGTLIDLNSPPSFYETKKPDLISRSSSSLSSHVESGFEDDFGSLLSSGSTSPWSDQYSVTSSWTTPSSVSSPEPSEVIVPPIELKAPAKSRAPPVPKGSGTRSYCNPTIICVQPTSKSKPSRPPPPKILGPDGSPPMPSIPPPPPPADILDILHRNPQVPQRPSQSAIDQVEEEYCVANYDFESDHPDDLTFKAGDIIRHIQQINDEWMKGELCGRSGMFPISYVDVKAPSAKEGPEETTKVICTFPFIAETWDDLSLKEGDIIIVTKRIDNNWLYGSCEGKKGQFPVNFVQDISELEYIK
uniref:SH3 domain-containing protein 19 n=2 Tax=Lygus hesperus TaxID=30085 RepID=A0A146LHM5_LYGHE